MDAATLVRLAMAATGRNSQAQIAEALGVSHVAVGKWMRGENCPTFEQAGELAELAGLPPVSTAAEVRMNSKDGEKHRRFLRRIAQVAACVALAATFGRLNVQNDHAAEAGNPARNPVTLSIM